MKILRKSFLIAGMLIAAQTVPIAAHAGTCFYERYDTATGQWERVRERFVDTSQQCIARCRSSDYRNCTWSPSD
jgi:hypothetical protein